MRFKVGKSYEDNIIFSKNKGRKVGAEGAISSYGKTTLYVYEENFNADTNINVFQEAIREMIDFTTTEKVTMQIDNARYHQTNEVFQFYEDNCIKAIDWSPYSPDLNPIENVLGIIKDCLKGKTFSSMSSLMNKSISILDNIEEDTVKNYEMVFMTEWMYEWS